MGLVMSDGRLQQLEVLQCCFSAAGTNCWSGNLCMCCRSLGVWVRHFLVKRLGSLPGMTAALERGITIADVGCGCTPVDATV
jgi:hypothetical protein